MYSRVLRDEVEFHYARFKQHVLPHIVKGIMTVTTNTTVGGKLMIAEGDWTTSYPPEDNNVASMVPTPRSNADNAIAGSSGAPRLASDNRVVSALKTGASRVPIIKNLPPSK